MMPPWIVTCSCGSLVRASETMEEATTLVESQTRVVTIPLLSYTAKPRTPKAVAPSYDPLELNDRAGGRRRDPAQDGSGGAGGLVCGGVGPDGPCAGRPPLS